MGLRPKLISAATAVATVVLLAACGSHTATRPAAVPDLQAQLLTLGDLPTGWMMAPGAADGSSDVPGCLKTAEGPLRPTAKASVSFKRTAGLPSIRESLRSYGGQQAAGEYQVLTRTLGSCGQLTFNAGTYTFRGRLGLITSPPVGDQRATYQASLEAVSGGTAVTTTFDVAVVRHAQTVLLLLYATLGAPPAGVVTSLTVQAAARLS